jgi:hypothetical protein
LGKHTAHNGPSELAKQGVLFLPDVVAWQFSGLESRNEEMKKKEKE